MIAADPQRPTLPDSTSRMGALALCPVGDLIFAIDATRIDGVWDPISEPWRMAPEQRLDLSTHFRIRLDCDERSRRHLDIVLDGLFVTVVAAERMLVEHMPSPTRPLPEIVAALGQLGVQGLLPFRGRYAYLLDLEQLFRISFPEGA